MDGDSIPIALLHMERGHAGRVSVLRLHTRLKDSTSNFGSGPGSGSTEPWRSSGRPGRVYEYVDVRLLYESLVRDVIPQCLGRNSLPSHAGHEISMLVCLIGLSGTDFTRGLPLVSEIGRAHV